MKKLTLLLVTFIISFSLISQTPQAFKYQAVVRDNTGEIIASEEVSFRISIHDETPAGTIIFQETHQETTNEFGLANIEIGNGTPIIDTISGIDWGTNDKFLEVELDPDGGSAFTSMGTTQLLAVPYALYSESSGDAGATEINDLTDGRTLGNSVFLGSGAGNNDDGSTNNNTAIGINALTSNTIGWGNTANGYAALYSSETRFRNTAIGYRALYSSTFGDYNTASGSEALYSNTTGDANTAVGDGALYSNTSGIRNVGFGFSANWNNQEGSQNTIIGFQAGYGTGLHNKNGNIFLGYRAGYNETGDNKLYIENSNSSSPLIYGEFDNDILAFNANVGIGTTNPYAKLDVRGIGTDDGAVFRLGNSDGSHRLSFFPGRENDPNPFIQWKEGDPLRFSTDEGGWSEKMRIASDGNVGIGTATPLTKLHIEDVDISLQETDLLNELLTIEDSDAGLGLYSDDGGGYGSVLSMGEVVSGNLNNKWSIFRTTSINTGFENQLRFSYGTDPSYTNNPSFLTLDEDGNVGIGISNPGHKLEVVGSSNTTQLVVRASSSQSTTQPLIQLQSNSGSPLLSINSDSPHNVFIGYQAGYLNDVLGYDGTYNTFIGREAGYNSSTGIENTAIGHSSLRGITTGRYNTAIGVSALHYVSTTYRNTALGRCAGRNLRGGDNVVIGYNADFYNQYGSYNTIIGCKAGIFSEYHDKSGNVFIGYSAGYYETGDDKLYIENSDSNIPLIGGDFSVDEIYLNGNVGIGTTSPTARLHVTGIDGVLFTGTFGSGTLPTTGLGTRMMWYPAKAAFRAGYVGGTQWDDANIGDYSVAIGASSMASGFVSTAMGRATEASGTASTAMGDYTEASGSASTAMGRSTTASANYSTAMGAYVSTSGEGSFMIGDKSTTTVLSNSIANRFMSRFAGGYYLYTNSATSIGAALPANSNSWVYLSDSTKKENFKPVDGEIFLSKISSFNLTSWNYIGQDAAKFRHYGPMAQDFYAAFGHDGIGTIGCDTLLSSSDFDGINFIAIQALEKRTSKLQSENEQLKEELAMLKSEMERFESLLQKLDGLSAINKQENQKEFANSE
jgi:hypothetical protein